MQSQVDSVLSGMRPGCQVFGTIVCLNSAHFSSMIGPGYLENEQQVPLTFMRLKWLEIMENGFLGDLRRHC